jgi:hypothetical protein
MPLAHFTMIDSHKEKWEPIHSNLYEVTIILPEILQSIHPDATHLLLENSTTATMPTYKELSVIKQKFKYSSRVFLSTPADTSIDDMKIKFNLNQNDDYQIFVFKMLKDWYDLGWNNETGTLHYKKNMVGDVIIHQHDREGKVIRRVTYHNCQMKNFTGMETLAWDSNTEVMSLEASWAVDYWEDFYY